MQIDLVKEMLNSVQIHHRRIQNLKKKKLRGQFYNLENIFLIDKLKWIYSLSSHYYRVATNSR